MTTTEIIRPNPPDPIWEDDLTRTDPRAVLGIQQMALHWNPFRAARWLTALMSETVAAETEGEIRALVEAQVTALWPLGNDRRFRRVHRVIRFRNWCYRAINKVTAQDEAGLER